MTGSCQEIPSWYLPPVSPPVLGWRSCDCDSRLEPLWHRSAPAPPWPAAASDWRSSRCLSKRGSSPCWRFPRHCPRVHSAPGSASWTEIHDWGLRLRVAVSKYQCHCVMSSPLSLKFYIRGMNLWPLQCTDHMNLGEVGHDLVPQPQVPPLSLRLPASPRGRLTLP